MGLPVELSIPSISTFAAMLLVCAVTPREIFCNQFAQSNCCLRAEFLRGLKKIYRYDERHFAPKAVCRLSQLYDCKARVKRLQERAMQTRTPPPVVASAKQLDVRVGPLTLGHLTRERSLSAKKFLCYSSFAEFVGSLGSIWKWG